MKVGLIALGLTLITEAAGIDFTTALSVKRLESFSVPVLTFTAGMKRVSYKPPLQWESIGSPEELTLTPPRPAGAVMKLFAVRWSMEENARFASSDASELKWASRFLPSGATDAVLSATHESPYMLGSCGSREWIIKHTGDGVPQTTSISRCDISSSERVVVVISCPAQEFQRLREAGIASLFSWESQ